MQAPIFSKLLRWVARWPSRTNLETLGLGPCASSFHSCSTLGSLMAPCLWSQLYPRFHVQVHQDLDLSVASGVDSHSGVIRQLHMTHESWDQASLGVIALGPCMWQTLVLAYLITIISFSLIAVVIQSLSSVWLFETPWTTACQVSLSFTISRSLLKFMSIESVMLSNLISSSAFPFSFCLHLSLQQSLSKNSVLTILSLFPIWSKLEKWKSGCLMSWPQIFKKCHFEVSSLILHNNNEPFLNWIVMCNKKWILYENQWWPAQWSDREEAPKNFPKPNFHQKKVMVTVWWTAVCLIHYSFLNPSETITSEK